MIGIGRINNSVSALANSNSKKKIDDKGLSVTKRNGELLINNGNSMKQNKSIVPLVTVSSSGRSNLAANLASLARRFTGVSIAGEEMARCSDADAVEASEATERVAESLSPRTKAVSK